MAAFVKPEWLTNFQVNEEGIREYLESIFWPPGLQDLFIRNLKKMPKRYFLCDDSGSMVLNDGHRLLDIPSGGKMMVSCTRWSELVQSLMFHVDVSRAAGVPSEFQAINGGQPVLIGTDDEDPTKLASFFENWPNGKTPLCRHLKNIIAKLEILAPDLREQGQKACLVIITDGEATDGDIFETIQPLKDLPVWIVVRLCTDEASVVKYWNDVDKELENQVDVLDDFIGEAKEVHQFNSWLTYGDALQKLREFGCSVRDLDMIDEGPLSLDSILTVCSYIFGGNPNQYPHPAADWEGFKNKISALNEKYSTWNVLDGTERPWIDIDEVAKVVARGP